METQLRRRPNRPLALLVWTLLGLCHGFALLGNARLRSQPMTLDAALGWCLGESWLWMLLSPLPLALARRVGYEAKHWRRAVAVHVPAALLLGLFHHVVFLTAYWRWGSPLMTRGEPLDLSISLAWRLHDALIVYALILLSAYTVHHLRSTEAARAARSEAEAQLANARLQALRAQLQPHFLFNTLNGISALVAGEPAQAKAMIARLGDLLRITLEDSDAQEVPLRRELSFLSGYLELQRLRFRDRLSVSVEAARDTLELRVPSLVLQPLVENAVEHGLSRRRGPATLVVRSRREGDTLLMEVEDDGPGLAVDLAEGVGLGNTRSRLKARYGDAASLEVASRPGGGVLASVRLPAGGRP